MNDWWRKKKSKTRKSRKGKEHYTKGDFLLDILFWIPEVLIFPIRLIFWSLRGLWRWVIDVI
ncbi:hypothetical protein [Oceanobacillus jeddahense]|uniref:Uncharacterized protein n=1 Tax=Oceanobacillus jeddahense TaxID=1462527 RepID=A0ABY5JZA6_9BACI|nr:hypothetical protein [Oceanobacillus jeddahense]UUI04752.1 hypothetical protein NP439_08995 [Oceanobacillus jeddahense]